MSARDDYRAVYLMQHSPDANKAFADQINAALDEIDALRMAVDQLRITNERLLAR